MLLTNLFAVLEVIPTAATKTGNVPQMLNLKSALLLCSANFQTLPVGSIPTAQVDMTVGTKSVGPPIEARVPLDPNAQVNFGVEEMYVLKTLITVTPQLELGTFLIALMVA
jgi:hypothetical protein